MINEQHLCFGDVYYIVTYTDEDMLLPKIRTLVFIGKNIKGNEEKAQWYFQDTESYAVSECPNVNKIDVELHRVDHDGLSIIFDFKGLHEDLQKCFERRRKETKGHP